LLNFDIAKMTKKSEIIAQAFKALRAGVLPEARAIISEQANGT